MFGRPDSSTVKTTVLNALRILLEIQVDLERPYVTLQFKRTAAVKSCVAITEQLIKIQGDIDLINQLLAKKEKTSKIENVLDAALNDWKKVKELFKKANDEGLMSLDEFPKDDYKGMMACVPHRLPHHITRPVSEFTKEEKDTYRFLANKVVEDVNRIDELKNRHPAHLARIKKTIDRYYSVNKALSAVEDKVILLANGPDDIATTDSNSDSNSSDNSPSSSPKKPSNMNNTPLSEVKSAQDPLLKFSVKPSSELTDEENTKQMQKEMRLLNQARSKIALPKPTKQFEAFEAKISKWNQVPANLDNSFFSLKSAQNKSNKPNTPPNNSSSSSSDDINRLWERSKIEAEVTAAEILHKKEKEKNNIGSYSNLWNSPKAAANVSQPVKPAEQKSNGMKK